ncbi:haloacid dehalogenase type II [Pseudooceanicola sp. MF1-13]|uniref:haloacid dehalogenase type II n=1 Tax=Pseudooceanicola sp. MF1-13 TaxID=3379095 RepID=UPI0038919224
MKIQSGDVLAFDVYGTLIDIHALTPALSMLVGSKAAQLSQIWRQKQLEYAFRRGLMGAFVPFSTVTGQALDYALKVTGENISADERDNLLERYRTLDAFIDARPAMQALSADGVECHAFSNGDPEDIESLLRSQGLWGAMHGAVSVLPAQTFKPAPAAYEHFCKTVDAKADRCWIVSSNPFDVMGAMNAGWRSIWVQRNPEDVFDPWGVEPTLTIQSLSDLPEYL